MWYSKMITKWSSNYYSEVVITVNSNYSRSEITDEVMVTIVMKLQ
jgi:hypothetical protein